jgi:hypothetical protein
MLEGLSDDAVYRLKNETIGADPNGLNGALTCQYDNVGNRQQLTSTLAPVPAGLWSYNANDQFTSDSYDGNGNTIARGGLSCHVPSTEGGINLPEMTDSLRGRSQVVVSPWDFHGIGLVGADVSFITSLGTGGR